MAAVVGSIGKVYFGTNAVGEVIEFEYDEEAPQIQKPPAMLDTAAVFSTGLKKGAGTVKLNYDSADVQQQGMDASDAITLNLYPEGNATGKKYRSGPAVITSLKEHVATEEYTSQEFSFSGTLLRTTVP